MWQRIQKRKLAYTEMYVKGLPKGRNSREDNDIMYGRSCIADKGRPSTVLE